MQFVTVFVCVYACMSVCMHVCVCVILCRYVGARVCMRVGGSLLNFLVELRCVRKHLPISCIDFGRHPGTSGCPPFQQVG